MPNDPQPQLQPTPLPLTAEERAAQCPPGEPMMMFPHCRLLTTLEVETALAWIASPVLSPPPQELENLSQVEWFVLSQFLQTTLSEKDKSQLQ